MFKVRANCRGVKAGELFTQPLAHKRPITERDGTGFAVKRYEDMPDCIGWIAKSSLQNLTSNGLDVTDTQRCAYIQRQVDTDIKVGDTINGYEVADITEGRQTIYAALSEVVGR